MIPKAQVAEEISGADCFYYKLDYKQDRGIERSLIMLLANTVSWIVFSVIGVIVVVVIGKKIKDKYY
jgi:hypothetical protein